MGSCTCFGADVAKKTQSDAYLTPARCPECDYLMELSSNMTGDRAPTPGDWTICINCAAPLIFTETMSVRTTTLRERNEAPPGLLALVKMVSMVGGGRGPGGRRAGED